MNENKRLIQGKLVENLRRLSLRFARQVSARFYKKREVWMVSKLKNKCIQFLDSLLEGNDGSFILTRIMAEIPQSILASNLAIVYRKFKDSRFTVFTEDLL